MGGVRWESYPSIFPVALQQNPALGTLPRVEGKGKTHDLHFSLSSFSKSTSGGNGRRAEDVSAALQGGGALPWRRTSLGPA